MSISIVVVSWNSLEVLPQCLESVVNAQWIMDTGSEIILVDNDSTDGSAIMVQARFPSVQLIKNHENLGFAGANNQALRRCLEGKREYALLLNPDTTVGEGALDSLIKFMGEHPECGAAGAKLLNADDSLQVSCAPFPSLVRELWRLFHLDKLYPLSRYPFSKWRVDTPQQVDSVQGAALMLRRETLEQVGLLDEDYFMYSEEVDLCHRIKSAGWEIYWVPDAEVVHYGGQSTRQVAREMFLELYRSKVLYFHKRHGLASAWVYKLILALSSLPRILLAPLSGNLKLAGNYSQLLLALPGM